MENKISIIYQENSNGETEAFLVVNDHVVLETGDPDDGADLSTEIETIQLVSRKLAKALNATVTTISKN